ncbi:Hypothetical protein CINCED_3A023478 [Cinara cedri]|uniref:Uncharacterized protein n=1 Tax=Cinara cedri TaxID=506608 RepID=A0A5E4MW59_9HEMI|nr:Hypothetical protein CINCED_3A023478 [Cinara cedri]
MILFGMKLCRSEIPLSLFLAGPGYTKLPARWRSSRKNSPVRKVDKVRERRSSAYNSTKTWAGRPAKNGVGAEEEVKRSGNEKAIKKKKKQLRMKRTLNANALQ